jgi:hypothetical protein
MGDSRGIEKNGVFCYSSIVDSLSFLQEARICWSFIITFLISTSFSGCFVKLPFNPRRHPLPEGSEDLLAL